MGLHRDATPLFLLLLANIPANRRRQTLSSLWPNAEKLRMDRSLWRSRR